MNRPFLKWAGGKMRLVPLIRQHLPPGRRLVEPFAGSAAVWLNCDYPQALIGDINPDLIRLYRVLKEAGEEFIAYCRSFFVPANNTPEAYYALREMFNQSRDPWQRSALFLYLNRHGYNGLCRYNQAGRFNVPFGQYRRPYFPETEMRTFWQKAQGAEFVSTDFRQMFLQLEPGDVVYCDPPYVPLSATASFTGYTADGFGAGDQVALAEWAKTLAARGIPVVISNHATQWTHSLYDGARQVRVPVSRPISCRASARGPVTEVVAVFS
ncbi:DNA adenine methylase Dam [Sulfobacillus acidophilus DSM 10332]|uniref:Site-specific DNA-methyltransferase (adenine-specific) n=1 Tax=Sulfobacillus acidophilus (strain ATCC 700253 / DSM 10332 / NAL) TaxID=679936 RepID=G8TUE7_SULAD|nr:DNA adenine methylase Dam [Sulfobacillus acidophilus DSM 10332]